MKKTLFALFILLAICFMFSCNNFIVGGPNVPNNPEEPENVDFSDMDVTQALNGAYNRAKELGYDGTLDEFENFLESERNSQFLVDVEITQDGFLILNGVNTEHMIIEYDPTYLIINGVNTKYQHHNNNDAYRVSVSSAYFNESEELIVILSNRNSVNCGKLKETFGEYNVEFKIGENTYEYKSKNYKIYDIPNDIVIPTGQKLNCYYYCKEEGYKTWINWAFSLFTVTEDITIFCEIVDDCYSISYNLWGGELPRSARQAPPLSDQRRRRDPRVDAPRSDRQLPPPSPLPHLPRVPRNRGHRA